MMYTRNEIDSITVVITMIARSVTEPRTYATAMAAMMPSTVSRIKMGIITVNVAGNRVAKMLLIASPVAQLLPQLKVKIDLTKIHSCTYQGSFKPSCWRMAWICSGVASKPPRISAGSPPKNLNRKNTNRMTPASVGTICHSLRKMYAANRAAFVPSQGGGSADYAVAGFKHKSA